MLDVFALVVSVVSLISQAVMWIKTGPQVIVDISTVIQVGAPGEPSRSCVKVTVTNDGRQAVSITALSLVSDSSNFSFTPGVGGVRVDKGSEETNLQPRGPAMVWLIDYQQLKTFAELNYPNDAHKLRAVVRNARKVYKSRTVLSMGDARATRISRIKRMLSIVRRWSVFAYFMVDRETDSTALAVRSMGFPVVRQVRIDLITNNGLDANSIEKGKELFPPEKIGVIPYGKTVYFPADWYEEMLNLPLNENWMVRIRWKWIGRKAHETRLFVSGTVLRENLRGGEGKG